MRQEREKRGMSQSALAAAMATFGVSLHFSTIAKMESREGVSPRAIRLNEAVAAAGALGIPLDHMLSSPTDAFRQARWLLGEAAKSATEVSDMVEAAFEQLRAAGSLGFDPNGEIDPDIQRERVAIIELLAELQQGHEDAARAEVIRQEIAGERDPDNG